MTHASGQVPTALAVDDDLNLVAVGFDNGTLILLRGDLRRDRGAKQKTLLTGGSSGISGSIVGVSGLAFRASKLYAATSTEVLLFNVKDKDKESCHRLDDIGCELGKFYTALGIQKKRLERKSDNPLMKASLESKGPDHPGYG